MKRHEQDEETIELLEGLIQKETQFYREQGLLNYDGEIETHEILPNENLA